MDPLAALLSERPPQQLSASELRARIALLEDAARDCRAELESRTTTLVDGEVRPLSAMLSLPNELLGCLVDECLFAAAIALGQACTVTRAAVDARKQRVAVECGCPVPTTAEVRAFWTALSELDNVRFTMDNGTSSSREERAARRKHEAVVKQRPMVKYLAALGAFGEVPAGWTGEAPSLELGSDARRCIEAAIVRCAKAAHAAGRREGLFNPTVTLSDFVVAVESACSPRFFARQFTHRQIKLVVENLIVREYIERDTTHNATFYYLP